MLSYIYCLNEQCAVAEFIVHFLFWGMTVYPYLPLWDLKYY